ncbi:INNER NO OUTER family protein [Salix suchowensis]|nr:INNER NO OUTER family protein [Salix suchowensis]
MSTLNHLLDPPDQICYVQCGFCTTILLVSVPCSSSSTVVTVICGHCSSLLSVNLMKISFLPFSLLTSLSHDHEQKELLSPDEVDAQEGLETQNSFIVISSDNDEDIDKINPVNRVINKPPEKRQRAPSAYNCFIKDSKAQIENPNMAHKEAFSTAAKNWAHCPHVHCKDDGESIGLEDENSTWSSDAAEVNIESKGFHERKVPRDYMWAKTPLE